MSASASKHRKPAFGGYDTLIRRYRLRAINSQADYNEAAKVLDNLALRGDLDAGEEEYLGALEVLITAYDDKHVPEQPDDRSPLERLKTLMEVSGTNASGLREILGSSQPMVSMVLSGQRELSKKAIAKLADHFKVEPGYFL